MAEPLPLYNELAIRHGLALSYRSKGAAPSEIKLLVQSKTISDVVTQIDPTTWIQVAEKTFELKQPFLPEVTEVTLVTATLPISWRGVADIWR
ncbi:MAG: hypothetical protein HC938_17720 [Nitrospira sp.]|nr:hypothetical protein [Nitrospira sp.]